MENQHNKSGDDDLKFLRQEIDAIDDEMIKLLDKRMQVVQRVGDLKEINQEKFFIRSNREADMIKGLLAKATKFPKLAIINIWRKIIVAANMHEQPLKVGLSQSRSLEHAKALVREYYSSAVPVEVFENEISVMDALKRDNIKIGVFALPNPINHEEWWVDLAHNIDEENPQSLKIFARIPFYESDDEVFVAVAAKNAEKSQEDNSLVYMQVSDRVLEPQILTAFEEAGFAGARVLKSAAVGDDMAYLVELSGFYGGDAFKDLGIGSLVKVIGHYAVAVKCEG